MLRVAFESLIEKYDLKVVSVDDSEALVVGQKYALRFATDRDALNVTYLERNSHGQISAYTLRPLVMQKFMPEDRAAYGNPITIEEKLSASLNVYASGLEKRCQDLLRGDKSWLRNDWEDVASVVTKRALENEGF